MVKVELNQFKGSLLFLAAKRKILPLWNFRFFANNIRSIEDNTIEVKR